MTITWDALLKVSEATHILYEFKRSPYLLAEEIARLRRLCGDRVCPVYAPVLIDSKDSGDIDDLPF